MDGHSDERLDRQVVRAETRASVDLRPADAAGSAVSEGEQFGAGAAARLLPDVSLTRVVFRVITGRGGAGGCVGVAGVGARVVVASAGRR